MTYTSFKKKIYNGMMEVCNQFGTHLMSSFQDITQNMVCNLAENYSLDECQTD